MAELTDLEIKVEIAKIHLSSDYDIHKREHNGYVGYLPRDCIGKLTEFDPLEDGLNHRLMIEFKVHFEADPYYVGRYLAFIRDDQGNLISPKTSDTSPNRAILLAIIKSHKVK